MYMNNILEREFYVEFLELYKSLPALWKIKSAAYNSRALKAEAYEIMVQKLKEIDPNANREIVVKKINNFRTCYRRDQNRKKEIEKSGTTGENAFKSSLWYFDLLSFLHDVNEDSPEGMLTMDEIKIETEDSEVVVERSSRSRTSKRKRHRKEKNESLQVACEHLEESNNDASTLLAKVWAVQYSELSSQQKVFARKLFSDVLFAGCLEKLNERVVHGVNGLLESSNRSSKRRRLRSSPSWSDKSLSSSSPN